MNNRNQMKIQKEKTEDKHAKDKNYRKVREHCRYSGKYSGAAHSLKI